MSGPNSHHDWRKSFSSTKLLNWLLILSLIIPVIASVIAQWNLQDIYWEECPSPTPGSQPLHSKGFNIVNASFIKSRPLTFTVTVDVPLAQVAAAKTSDNARRLLNDPNNDLVIVIDLHEKKNKLYSKRVFGKNSTIIEISRRAGLAGHNATMINFLWQRGKHVRLIDTKLYSGAPTSPYYKKYPHASERQLLAQTKWQIVVCLAIAVAVILTAILVKWLLNTREKRDNTETRLADTKRKLADMKIKLDKALQAIQGSKVGATLPVEEDAAKEYEQKTQEETTEEMNGGKQESSENKADQRSGKREKPVKKKKAKKKPKKKH